MKSSEQNTFNFALETVKQVITLSTGIIAITVAFVGSNTNNLSSSYRLALHIAWVTAALSVGTGLLTMLSLSGAAKENEKTQKQDIYAGHIRWPMAASIVFFSTSLVATIVYGFSVY